MFLRSALCGVLLFFCLIGTTIDLLDDMFNTSLIPKDISDIATERKTEISMNSKQNSYKNSVEVNADGYASADDVVLLKHSSTSVIFLNILASVKGNVRFLFPFKQPL